MNSISHCNDTNNLEGWSTFCLNVEFLRACYPSKNYNLKFVTGIWCVVLGFIGFVGNLLTIVAIPYAAKNKRYQLNSMNYSVTTLV